MANLRLQFPCPLSHEPTKLSTPCFVSAAPLVTGGKSKQLRPKQQVRHHRKSHTRRFVVSQRRRRGRRGGGMAVAGIVGEAFKGAVREAWTAQGVAPLQRFVIFFTLLGLIVRGVWGNLTLLKYAAYAYWLHATLRPWGEELEEEKVAPDAEARNGNGNGHDNSNSSKNVGVARDVRYGAAQRNLLDVYVPCKRKLKGERLKPVVIFVHGGVWASGDKWQFTPLASFLAEEGVIAVLPQYTLYPEVLAIDQVGEVSSALTWTMDNIAQYGGDPNRVFIMGHSSGAHLCAMVLWERASRRVENAQRPLPSHLDMRIPHGFLGLAGVYNIGEHFKYEVLRGVGAVSCMRPANGWEAQFDSMSPSLLFESLLLQKDVEFVAAGETGPRLSKVPNIRGLDLAPRCLLIASNHDITVPPTSSLAFNAMLQTLGCETRVVLHDEMAHDDFCLWHRGWGTLKTHLGPFLEEVLRFVTVDES